MQVQYYYRKFTYLLTKIVFFSFLLDIDGNIELRMIYNIFLGFSAGHFIGQNGISIVGII